MADVTLIIQNKTVPVLTVKPQALNQWGTIGGTLSAQTDLAAALAAKYDASNPAGYITSSAVAAAYLPLTLIGPTNVNGPHALTFAYKNGAVMNSVQTDANHVKIAVTDGVKSASILAHSNADGTSSDGSSNNVFVVTDGYAGKGLIGATYFGANYTNNSYVQKAWVDGQFVTSATAAATYEALANKGLANGYAPLDATGKIDTSYLPSAVLGAASYQGTWNASTNTPSLASGVGTKGHYYVVTVAGSTSIDGTSDWKLGDWIIYNGATWDKVDNTDAVISVNGQVGAVSLTGTAGRITISGSNVFDVGADVALNTLTLGQFASTTSAQLAGIISDKTGTGSLVFATAPTLNADLTVNGTAATNFILLQNTTSSPSPAALQNSPRLRLVGNNWSSLIGPAAHEAYLQSLTLSSNNSSPTSKLSFFVGANGTTPTEKMYISSTGIFYIAGGADFSGSSLSDTFNVYIRNTAAATSGAAQSSNKLVLEGQAWNNTQGSAPAQAYLQYITTTNNANPTVGKLSFFVSSANFSPSFTEVAGFYTSGQVNIGNYATPTNLRAFTIGQDTAFMTFGSNPNVTSIPMMWMQQATPSNTNWTLQGYDTYAGLNSGNSAGTVALLTGGTTRFQLKGISSAGTSVSFEFTKPNNTGQTSGAAISGWVHNAGTRSWNNSGTVTIATQIENAWNQATYSNGGSGTLTFTSAYGNYFYAPTTSGTGVAITNPYAAGFGGNVDITGRLYLGGTTNSYLGDKLHIYQTAAANTISIHNPTANAYSSILFSQSSTLYGGLYRYNSGMVGNFTGTSFAFADSFQLVSGNGNDKPLMFSCTPLLVQVGTAGTNKGLRIDAAGLRVGTLATLHTANTVGFELDDALDIKLGATTGTKIGTATTQKIGFWNAAPIVQPTTGVASATFAAVAGGSAIDTTDTFDGYTIGRVVKALRNVGLLA